MSVYAGGSRTTLTAVEATDPTDWPGLDAITQAAAAVQRVGLVRAVGYETPHLGTRLATTASCGTRPAELRGRRGLVLWIGIPTDGVGLVGGCTELTLFHDDSGAIDAAPVSDTRAPTSPPGPPDVVGNSAAVARDRLEAAGYAVDQVTGPDCGPVGTCPPRPRPGARTSSPVRPSRWPSPTGRRPARARRCARRHR